MSYPECDKYDDCDICPRHGVDCVDEELQDPPDQFDNMTEDELQAYYLEGRIDIVGQQVAALATRLDRFDRILAAFVRAYEEV